MSEYKNEQLINLYLEQIKYLVNEKISIQNQFLAGVNLPLVALGLLIYNLEKNASIQGVENIYLLLPFLYLLIPYNLIKFSTRMLGINGYLKYLEQQINALCNHDVFLWNHKLINCSIFPGGFATITTLGQIPIHMVTITYLIVKFYNIICLQSPLNYYHMFLIVCLILIIIIMILMLLDTAFVQKTILKKLSPNGNKGMGKKYTVYIKENR